MRFDKRQVSAGWLSSVGNVVPPLLVVVDCQQQTFTQPPAAACPADPANPIRKEWLHWLACNIPAGGDITQGHEVGNGGLAWPELAVAR